MNHTAAIRRALRAALLSTALSAVAACDDGGGRTHSTRKPDAGTTSVGDRSALPTCSRSSVRTDCAGAGGGAGNADDPAGGTRVGVGHGTTDAGSDGGTAGGSVGSGQGTGVDPDPPWGCEGHPLIDVEQGDGGVIGFGASLDVDRCPGRELAFGPGPIYTAREDAGSLFGLQNDRWIGCELGGIDAYYRFRPPVGGTARLAVEADFDFGVAVGTSCEEPFTTRSSCNQSHFFPFSTSFRVDAGQDYWLRIERDGYYYCYRFELTIE